MKLFRKKQIPTPAVVKTRIQELMDNGQLKIGRYTYGYNDSTFHFHNPDEKITVGAFCSIAGRVTIFGGGEHDYKRPTTFPLNYFFSKIPLEYNHDAFTKGPTIIGNDVWLGFDCLIKSGVTLGDGVVVGAKSVVTTDLPPYSIAVGNPAKVIKFRFSKEQIDSMLKIAWWNWPEERIREHIDILSNDINHFINKFEV